MPVIKDFNLESDDLVWEISDLAGGFHVNCVDPKSEATGSSFDISKDMAKQKAFCELNERSLYLQLAQQQDLQAAWGLDIDGSGSGFAAGFSSEKTAFRSLCEGIERWTLSQWIDNGYALRATPAPEGRPVVRQTLQSFDSVDFLTTEIALVVEQKMIKVHVSVALAWKGDGVFVGYGTKSSRDESLEHACVESLRNWLIFKNQKKRSRFPYNRIEYFAHHADAARAAIGGKREMAWAVPVVRFFKIEKFGEIYLARTIFEGWTPWQHGPVERFLY